METPEALKRSLPHAIDCEKKVLSSLIYDSLKYFDLGNELGLTAESFYKKSHAQIYEIIESETKKGIEIDMTILFLRLDEKGILENVGGRGEVADIACAEPLHSNFSDYVKIITEKHMMRKAIVYGHEVIEQAHKTEDSESLLSLLNKSSDDFETANPESNNHLTAKEVLAKTADMMEERSKSESKAVLSTPWSGFNRATGGGLTRGELHFFCGRPSSGKSLVAGNLLNEWGSKGEPCAIHSFETSEEGYMMRLIACRNKIPIGAIIRGKLITDQVAKLKKDSKKIENMPIHFKRYAQANRINVARSIRKLCAQGVMTHVIDYLQKCDPANIDEARSDKLRIDAFLREIDQVRRATGCTIIMLAQTSRDMDTATLSQLRLSMIADTSTAEKDADSIWFILKGWDNSNAKPEDDEVTDGLKERALYCLKGRDSGTEQRVKLNMAGAYSQLLTPEYT